MMSGIQTPALAANRRPQPGLLACVFTLCCLLTACSTKNPDKLTIISGAVTKIHDGDSIHITPSNQKRQIIRFAGIDAPELKQAGGIASRNKLRSLLGGKSAEAQCHKLDKYKRNVCSVYLNKTGIGLAMVQSGHAWHYTKYQSEQSASERRRFKRAQKKAINNNSGIWAQESPMPPWEYRRLSQ